ncbi:MAG: cbb3-type cytochrome c oxidase subunit I [Chloroflexi bacterium]|nr:cbb3-type cytochrome c oxidase subunit I [Chloroflexota bacterium]
MSRTTLGFIFSSMVYLTLGVALGVAFLIFPDLKVLRTVHVHLNLVGFVSFMIFGVAFHILPRFKGQPLHSEGLAWLQLWLANIGLLGLVAFQCLEVLHLARGTWLTLGLAASGVLLGLSFYLFLYNMLRTLTAKDAE